MVLMALLGRPILSTMALSSSRGMTLADLVLDAGENLGVSSMRVPIGGRTCRAIWPVSTEGKKFEPRNGASAKDTSTKARKPVTNSRRRTIASASRLR